MAAVVLDGDLGAFAKWPTSTRSASSRSASPMSSRAILDDPAITRASGSTLTASWLNTEDLGRRDTNGYLLADRAQEELIIREDTISIPGTIEEEPWRAIRASPWLRRSGKS